MSIVDAHFHLVQPDAREYPWIAGDYLPLLRRWSTDDLREVARPLGVDRAILVQTVADAAETREFLDAAARSDGVIAGVVGWVDLTADAATALDGLLAGEPRARLVGVRHPAPAEPDADWLARPDVSRGLRALADRGLVFDLLVTARELPAALVAVDTIDDLSFVVDHGAKPPIAAGEFEPWRDRLRAVAARPHVTCKVSGLVTEAHWPSWTPAALQPYVDTLMDLFGPERLMWGSDWPVCTVAAAYADVLAAAQSCLSTLSVDESQAVFAGTACRVYGLPPATAGATG